MPAPLYTSSTQEMRLTIDLINLLKVVKDYSISTLYYRIKSQSLRKLLTGFAVAALSV